MSCEGTNPSAVEIDNKKCCLGYFNEMTNMNMATVGTVVVLTTSTFKKSNRNYAPT